LRVSVLGFLTIIISFNDTVKDQLILGYDFGTSAVKVALFSQNGTLIDHASDSYPLILPQKGWAEQRPDDWWQSTKRATEALLAKTKVDVQSIRAIGLCAQMCGTVAVDKRGRPLHNALIWLDTRSEAIAKRITSGLIKVSGYGLGVLARWLWLTNGAPNLSGKDPISKMLWFKEEKPEVWQSTEKLLDVKDYLIHRFCGEFVTTQDCAHVSWLMDTRPNKRDWSTKLLKAVKLHKNLLPRITHASDVVGGLSGEAAKDLGLPAGIAIVGGVGDVAAYALGCGNIDDGAVHMHCGTGGWIAAHLDHRAVDIFSGVATVCAPDPNRYLLIAAQESAGSCINWAAEKLNIMKSGAPDFSAFDELVLSVDEGANGVLFFPWLYGERVPVDDSAIRGGFVNLSMEHTRADMARAVLEGVALNSRWALEPFEKITKTKNEIRLMGGGAVSTVWCQIFADVLQRSVIQVEKPEFGGCRGAAMSASVGAGIFESLEAATSMVKVAQTFKPRSEFSKLYEHKFSNFKKYYKCNKNWYAKINKR